MQVSLFQVLHLVVWKCVGDIFREPDLPTGLKRRNTIVVTVMDHRGIYGIQYILSFHLYQERHGRIVHDLGQEVTYIRCVPSPVIGCRPAVFEIAVQTGKVLYGDLDKVVQRRNDLIYQRIC